MTKTLETQEDIYSFAVSVGTMEWNKTGSWRYMRPRYENKIPPCTVGCPTNEKIPRYFALVNEKKYEAAWHIILEDNPLPGVCGRVCYHPCETVCNRLEYDEPIAINHLERFVADQNFTRHFPKHFFVPKNGRKVAIVGSGPAGLSAAYQLARRGYEPIIYEAHEEAGGMLRLGIPEYRLPREILDKEINDIISLGVTIKTGVSIGTTISWDSLKKDYDVVLIATGAHKPRSIDLPGSNLAGVASGLSFLTRYNLTGEAEIASRLLVVGGGNTAIDTARTAIRLGADVTLVYRRSRDEMPAVPEEIEAAEQEGVKIRYLTAPIAFLGTDKLEKVRLIRMELGTQDKSGRRRPIPILGSEYEVEVEQVLLAIGEIPRLDFLPHSFDKTGKRVTVDSFQLTNQKGVFACGDVAAGPVGTVVDAIATGKTAALAIDQYLAKGEIVPPSQIKNGVPYEELNLDYFFPEQRAQSQFTPASHSFDEVHHGLEPDAALYEARRCFSCGVCTECDLCLIYCPDVAISRSRNGSGYVINYDYCKGCGVCVKECPRNAMTFEEEVQ